MKKSRGQARFAVLCTILFSLLAHGYRYLTLSFSADSVQISQADEIAYQISLGRFMQPVLWHLRGMLTVPSTIGLFATAFLAVSILLVLRMLRFERRLSVALVCGILATNETLAVSNGTYLPWTDVYMLALLLSMTGVYVTQRFRWGWLAAPVFYFLSLGAYQSYLQAAVTLSLLLFIVRMIEGESTARIWQDGVKAIISFLLGLILYAVGTRVIMAALHIPISTDYNTIANVGHYKPGEIPGLLIKTYRDPFLYFLKPGSTALIGPLLNAPLFALSVAAVVYLCRRLTPSAKATVLLLAALLPFGMNFVQFLTVWFKHTLMIYSHFFLYVFTIWLAEKCLAQRGDFPPIRVGALLAALLTTLGLYQNIATANQMVLKRDLEWTATEASMSRLIEIIDRVPGYVPGETPIVLSGLLNSSAVSMQHPGFSQIAKLQGMYNNLALLQETAHNWYAESIAVEPLKLVSADEAMAVDIAQVAPGLQAFPKPDCCRLIDGVLYVRLQ